MRQPIQMWLDIDDVPEDLRVLIEDPDDIDLIIFVSFEYDTDDLNYHMRYMYSDDQKQYYIEAKGQLIVVHH